MARNTSNNWSKQFFWSLTLSPMEAWSRKQKWRLLLKACMFSFETSWLLLIIKNNNLSAFLSPNFFLLGPRHAKTRDPRDPGSRKFHKNYRNFLHKLNKNVGFNKTITFYARYDHIKCTLSISIGVICLNC